MKEFTISVQTSGYEYFTVQAETFEEAVEIIKKGLVTPFFEDNEWSSEFYIDDVEEI